MYKIIMVNHERNIYLTCNTISLMGVEESMPRVCLLTCQSWGNYMSSKYDDVGIANPTS